MSDEIVIEGVSYISSKRASQISGYAQDYIGQLARKSLIDAKRMGGLWYISMESLASYKENAAQFKPEPPKVARTEEADSFISFEGREYLSAARAAQITSYNQDYIGQLARAGTVLGRQVGNRWYVDRESLVNHKKQKDALLAAVQADSVGIKRPQVQVTPMRIPANGSSYMETEPFYSYTSEDQDLLPLIRETPESNEYAEGVGPSLEEDNEDREEVHAVPIRVARVPEIRLRRPLGPVGSSTGRHDLSAATKVVVPRRPSPVGFYATMAAGALTVVIVLSLGLYSFRQDAKYTLSVPDNFDAQALTANVIAAFSVIADKLEQMIAPELHYIRDRE